MPELFENGHALVIGVGADLPDTITDARAVGDHLGDPGRCAYPTNQVRVLTGKGAGRDAILEGLQWMGDATEDDDTAMIYFSGHGMETPDYFLLPHGYDLADLSGTAIRSQEFTSALQNIPTRKLIVVLDCCHAGGQVDLSQAVKSPIPTGMIETLQSGSGRVILSSSRREEVSYAGNPYSQFTKALLEGLAGHGATDKDGYARILDLAMWLAWRVPNLTGNKQHPTIKVDGKMDDFAVAYYAGGEKTPKALDGGAVPPEMPRGPEPVRVQLLDKEKAQIVRELQKFESQLALAGRLRDKLEVPMAGMTEGDIRAVSFAMELENVTLRMDSYQRNRDEATRALDRVNGQLKEAQNFA